MEDTDACTSSNVGVVETYVKSAYLDIRAERECGMLECVRPCMCICVALCIWMKESRVDILVIRIPNTHQLALLRVFLHSVAYSAVILLTTPKKNSNFSKCCFCYC